MERFKATIQGRVRNNGYGLYSEWEAWSRAHREGIVVDLSRDTYEQVREWVDGYYPPKEKKKE